MTSIPGPASNFSIRNANTLGTVVLSWTNPSQIGIPAINNYIFSCLPSSGITFSPIINIIYTTINASGLVAGNVYIFSVSIVNSAGTSTPVYSQPFTYVYIPSAPTSVSAISGPGQVTLSWNQGVVSGGLPITKYAITTVPVTRTTTINAGIFSTIINGLTNGTSYVFSVTQFNQVGQSAASTVTAIPRSAPNAPTNISIVSSPLISGSATISWTDPVLTGGSPITAYTITSYPSSGISYSQPFANPTNVFGLKLNISYIFIISAINSIGTSPGAISAVYTYNRIPEAPTGVIVSNSADTITVRWDPVVMNEGLPLTGFVVISTPASTSFNVPVGTFSQTFTKLIPGTSYTFTVYSRNALGVSTGTTSSPIIYSIFPGVATNIKVTNTILDGTSITWTDPVAPGGVPITSYTLSSTPAGAIFTGSTLSDDLVVTGLTVGTTYIFNIITNTSYGSSPLAVSAPFLYLTVPNTPTNVSVTPGSASAVITWTNVLSSGGTSIRNYIVSSTPPTSTITLPSLSSSYTFTGLTDGTAYTFNIIATNSFGSSSAAVSNSVTPTSVPNPPTQIIVTPGNTTALIQWTAPVLTGGLPITGYIIKRFSSGNATVSTPVGNISNTTITGLTNNISYTFAVNAVNSKGSSADSAISSAIIPVPSVTVPGAPENVTATASSGSSTPSILVSFTGPSVTGGTPIINFQYSTDGGTTYTSCNPSVISSPISITTTSANGVLPLSNGTFYTVLIRAINAVGSGAASSGINVTPTATVANAPSISSITPGNGSCSVEFIQSFNGGAEITNFSYSTDGGTTFTVFSPAQTTSPLTISGLGGGTTYSIKLKAINSVGESAASTASSVTIAGTVPPAPTNLSSSNITSSGFSIGFTRGSAVASSITNYSFSTDGGTTFLVFSPAKTTSPVAITTQSSGAALVAGATYSIKLREINAIGTSVASSSISVTVASQQSNVIDYPVITSATYNSVADTITIYFTPPTGVGTITNYSYSTDGGLYSVLELYPPQTTSPIVISNLSTFPSRVLNYNLQDIIYGISLGINIDIYLQLIPQTINTLCKASNTYKIVVSPENYNGNIYNYNIPSNMYGMQRPGAPGYGIISFNMATKNISSSINPGSQLYSIGSIVNYAYTTDDEETQLILSPPQIETITIKTMSDGSPISQQQPTYVSLFPIDSSGNIGIRSSVYTFTPRILFNAPESPTLLSVNMDYFGNITINYRSNDLYNIYTLLLYFYIGDSIPNFGNTAYNDLAINAVNSSNLLLLTIPGRWQRLFSMDLFTLPQRSYNNGIYTLKFHIGDTPYLAAGGILKIMTSKQFKVVAFRVNSSQGIFNGDTTNPATSGFLWEANRDVVSLPSNSITVGYSSYSPEIRVQYSSNGQLKILIPAFTWYTNDTNDGDPGYIAGTPAAGSNGNDEGFLPFNVGSYNNTVNLSIDGGTTFTSTGVTWNSSGLILNQTFTEGTLYNLIIQIRFVDVYGAQCTTGNSNMLTFTYGVPSFSVVDDNIFQSFTGPAICMLANGNAAYQTATNQVFSISYDGGTTFYSNELNYLLRDYNFKPDDFSYRFPNSVTLVPSQTYNIVVKCEYNAGAPILKTLSLTFPESTMSTPSLSTYILAINNMISQSNAVYLFIDTTIPTIDIFSTTSDLNIYISSTSGSLGNQLMVTRTHCLHNSSITASQHPNINALRIPMSNFTPGIPSYVSIRSSATTYTTTGNGSGVSNQYVFTPYLVPNPPTINGIIKTSTGYANIVFTPGSVNSTNNAPGGLTYLFSTDYFFTKTACTVDVGSGNIIIPLTAGTYAIQIQAVSAAGRSASSNVFSFTMT